MNFDGCFLQLDRPGDFLIGHAADQQLQHQAFALRQVVQHLGILGLCGNVGGDGGRKLGGFGNIGTHEDVRRHVPLAGHDQIQGAHHDGAAGAFGDKTGNAEVEGLEDQGLVMRAGKNDHRHGKIGFHHLAHAGKAVHAGHAEIQNDEPQVVGRFAGHDGAIKTFRFDDVHFFSQIFEKRNQAFADQSVIVSQNDVHVRLSEGARRRKPTALPPIFLLLQL